MAGIQHIAASNKQLRNRYQTVTAIFTGATHGIGLETLKAFLTHIPKPTAIVISRNRDKFAVELEALHQLNPNATLSFIEADLSLIIEIDRVCSLMERDTPPQSVHLLCMSQGYAPLGRRRFNKEGLDEAMTLAVYGRVRLAECLISQKTLASNARVVSILGGAKEGHLFLEDTELRENYSTVNLRGHFTSMMTLAFDHLSHFNTGMGFVHYHPGTVSTGMRNRVPDASFLLRVAMWIFTMLLNFVAMSPQESGERTLDVCFAEEYERGSFSLGYDRSLSQSEELEAYRRDERVRSRIWGHLEELFERALHQVDL